jgi:hypothetical protein
MFSNTAVRTLNFPSCIFWELESSVTKYFIFRRNSLFLGIMGIFKGHCNKCSTLDYVCNTFYYSVFPENNLHVVLFTSRSPESSAVLTETNVGIITEKNRGGTRFTRFIYFAIFRFNETSEFTVLFEFTR